MASRSEAQARKERAEQAKKSMLQCSIIDLNEQEVTEIFFRKPVLDTDGNQVTEDGKPQYEVFPAYKLVEKAKKYITDNIDKVEETMLWLARGSAWQGVNDLHVFVLAAYIGMLIAKNDLTIETQTKSVSKEEASQFVRDLIAIKVDELEKMGDKVTSVLEGKAEEDGKTNLLMSGM